eukprot:6734065-Prymnesium_polylepis.1
MLGRKPVDALEVAQVLLAILANSCRKTHLRVVTEGNIFLPICHTREEARVLRARIFIRRAVECAGCGDGRRLGPGGFRGGGGGGGEDMPCREMQTPVQGSAQRLQHQLDQEHRQKQNCENVRAPPWLPYTEDGLEPVVGDHRQEHGERDGRAARGQSFQVERRPTEQNEDGPMPQIQRVAQAPYIRNWLPTYHGVEQRQGQTSRPISPSWKRTESDEEHCGSDPERRPGDGEPRSDLRQTYGDDEAREGHEFEDEDEELSAGVKRFGAPEDGRDRLPLEEHRAKHKLPEA